MPGRPHHRPAPRDGAFFEGFEHGADPALLAEAADRAARTLIRLARRHPDDSVIERFVTLTDDEGLDTLAELWSRAPADTPAGCLWRLYLLRTMVYVDPEGSAEEFNAGRHAAPVATVVSGVAEPPGPVELKQMIDDVLRGIARAELADVLFRAAAFARVVVAGRAVLGKSSTGLAKLLTLSEQLEQAGHRELAAS